MKAAEMLHAAADLVGGQRANDYGDKLANHERIAALWNMWLRERKYIFFAGAEAESDSEIIAYDVAMMMLLVKVARLMNSPGHQDSHIDIAGYASIMEEIVID